MGGRGKQWLLFRRSEGVMERSRSSSGLAIPLQPATQKADGGVKVSTLFSFRPYDEHTGTRSRSGSVSKSEAKPVVRPVEVNVGAHKIVYNSDVTKGSGTTASHQRRPPMQKQRSYSPASAQLVVQGRAPGTASPSPASAVGSVTASMQSHRSLVERQIGKILGAPVS